MAAPNDRFAQRLTLEVRKRSKLLWLAQQLAPPDAEASGRSRSETLPAKRVRLARHPVEVPAKAFTGVQYAITRLAEENVASVGVTRGPRGHGRGVPTWKLKR